MNDHEDFTVNKLIILYLLAEVKMPLSLSQVTQIVLERGYTNYFSLQQYLNELEQSSFLHVLKQNNTSFFEITDKGIEALNFFSSRIPDFIRNELDNFIENNWRTFKSELDIKAEYIPFKSNEYIVSCGVTENDSTLISIDVTVGSKKQAVELCNNWRNNASSLYSQILQVLTN